MQRRKKKVPFRGVRLEMSKTSEVLKTSEVWSTEEKKKADDDIGRTTSTSLSKGI